MIVLKIGFAKIGYDPIYGARPLKMAIQKNLEDKIAKEIILGEIVPEKTVNMVFKNETIEFE